MRIVISGVVASILGIAIVVAQTTPPKPGPEHKRLERGVGQWNYQGEAKASPMGPAGKITGSETCELFQGGFAVVCRSKGTGPKGPMTGLNVTSYDEGQKAYTYYAISSQGDNIFVRGTYQGERLDLRGHHGCGAGTPMKIRATVTEESPTATAFKLEAGPADGQMMVIEEGKSTKVKWRDDATIVGTRGATGAHAVGSVTVRGISSRARPARLPTDRIS